MIEGMPDYVSVPLLIGLLALGMVAYGLVRGEMRVRRWRPPRRNAAVRRKILEKIKKR